MINSFSLIHQELMSGAKGGNIQEGWHANWMSNLVGDWLHNLYTNWLPHLRWQEGRLLLDFFVCRNSLMSVSSEGTLVVGFGATNNIIFIHHIQSGGARESLLHPHYCLKGEHNRSCQQSLSVYQYERLPHLRQQLEHSSAISGGVKQVSRFALSSKFLLKGVQEARCKSCDTCLNLSHYILAICNKLRNLVLGDLGQPNNIMR